MTTTKKKLLIGPAVVLGVTLSLAACGSSGDHEMGSMSTPAASAPATAGSSATPAAGPHNEADVTFAKGMIPHHTQAVEMAEMVLTKKDVDPKVTDLAKRIKEAQAPEISQMNGWLAGWGESAGSGMDHGGDDGMMDQADMDALKAADGAEASKLFLAGMIKHHQGAVAMAQTELAEGTNPDAKKLAQAIIDAQNAEIEEMKKLGAS
jgi:uncharacterized protein (DUF305 family)